MAVFTPSGGGTGNWSDYQSWLSNGNTPVDYLDLPANGDTVDLESGYINADLPVIPASGSLALLKATAGGVLLLGGDVVLHCNSFDCSESYNYIIYGFSNALTLVGNIIGSISGNGFVYLDYGTIILTGNIIQNGPFFPLITGTSTFVWTPGSQYYIQIGDYICPQQLLPAQVLKGTPYGTITPTLAAVNRLKGLVA